jgi:hypothetical protein
MFFGLLSKNIKEIETTLSTFFTGGRNKPTNPRSSHQYQTPEKC